MGSGSWYKYYSIRGADNMNCMIQVSRGESVLLFPSCMLLTS